MIETTKTFQQDDTWQGLKISVRSKVETKKPIGNLLCTWMAFKAVFDEGNGAGLIFPRLGWSIFEPCQGVRVTFRPEMYHTLPASSSVAMVTGRAGNQ